MGGGGREGEGGKGREGKHSGLTISLQCQDETCSEYSGLTARDNRTWHVFIVVFQLIGLWQPYRTSQDVKHSLQPEGM